jgi:hypothetical protein
VRARAGRIVEDERELPAGPIHRSEVGRGHTRRHLQGLLRCGRKALATGEPHRQHPGEDRRFALETNRGQVGAAVAVEILEVNAAHPPRRGERDLTERRLVGARRRDRRDEQQRGEGVTTRSGHTKENNANAAFPALSGCIDSRLRTPYSMFD